MPAPRTTLKDMRDVPRYLGRFPENLRSLQYELLLAEALSGILRLPFYGRDNDNPSVPHRVLWNGTLTPLRIAGAGGADAIAWAYDFYILLEATRKTGSNQWTQEFAPAIRHGEDFARDGGAKPSQVFVLLACEALSRDTYNSIHHRNDAFPAVIPVECWALEHMLETSVLAFTMRHADLRMLLNNLRSCALQHADLAQHRACAQRTVLSWRSEVLEAEKPTFIGTKSYRAMLAMGRDHIGISEIFDKLQRDPDVLRYCELAGSAFKAGDIVDGLKTSRLACRVGGTLKAEELFGPVCPTDCAERLQRIMHAVEGI